MHSWLAGGRFDEASRRCRWTRGAAALVCILLLQLWSGELRMTTQVSAQGSWSLLLDNAGIASMHTTITHFGSAIFLDRTNIGPSQINLPDGICRDNPEDLVLTHDCSAHSVEFYPDTNRVRPLFIFTDTWCSSGQVDANGVLVQTGGDYEGIFKIRRFAPCPESDGTCDWVEDADTTLQEPRWYATNLLLPDGRQIVVGGRQAPYIEFVPATGSTATILDFLIRTDGGNSEFDNLYPYVHLLPNGYLFMFANNESILYDYIADTTIFNYPTLVGGPRNYPAAGSSVMLPLQASDEYSTAEILVCGGAKFGAYSNPGARYPGTDTCGRIVATDAFPSWALETMPTARIMSDMVLLPDGTTLIINGAKRGSEGWGAASDPCFDPLNYDPNAPIGSRFTSWSPTTIPRMYHSTANLLPDGRVLIAGSNTHMLYTFTGDFPTELRVEAFSPPYLSSSNDARRPIITDVPTTLKYGDGFSVSFSVTIAPTGTIHLVLNSAPFVTHAYAQGQRQLVLATAEGPEARGGNSYTISGTAPPSAVLAPPSYYMLFVVNDGIPSRASWVRIS